MAWKIFNMLSAAGNNLIKLREIDNVPIGFKIAQVTDGDRVSFVPDAGKLMTTTSPTPSDLARLARKSGQAGG